MGLSTNEGAPSVSSGALSSSVESEPPEHEPWPLRVRTAAPRSDEQGQDCEIALRPRALACTEVLAPVSLAHKALFDRAHEHAAEPISDYVFTIPYIWAHALSVSCAVIEEHLCVFSAADDMSMLAPPMPLVREAGPASLERCLRSCFEIMDERNARTVGRDRSRIEYVSDEFVDRIAPLRGTQISVSPMHADYVYDTERMIDLAGGSLKSKRHARTRFLRENPSATAELLTPADIAECLELLSVWQVHGDIVHEGEVNDAHVGTDVLRARELHACRVALRNWQALGLTGMVVRVEGRVVGFTFGEALSARQSVIHIEKTHPAYHGAAQFIFSEFCRRCWSEYPECNVGDDWGIPSLRFTKMSYRPRRLLSKSILTRQPVVQMAGFSPMELSLEGAIHALAPMSCSSEAPSREESASAVTLRTAAIHDVDAIIRLEERCFDLPTERFNRRQVRSLITNPRADISVVELDGSVVGWAVGLTRQTRRGLTGRLYGIGIDPSARGRSLGRLLAQRVCDRLAERGITRIYLEVRKFNSPAIQLYKSLGFETRAMLPGYYGSGVDGLRMRRLTGSEATPTLFPGA